MPIYVTLIAAFFVIAAVGTGLLRCRMPLKLYRAVVAKDREECLRRLNSLLFRMVFSGYEYLGFYISTAIELHSEDMLAECCQRQKAVIMKKEKREGVLFRLASCWIDWGNRERAEELIEELRQEGSVSSLRRIERMYHVYLLKDDTCLSEMEEEFQTAREELQKRELAAYLAEQYENRGDSATARKYLDYIEKK